MFYFRVWLCSLYIYVWIVQYNKSKSNKNPTDKPEVLVRLYWSKHHFETGGQDVKITNTVLSTRLIESDNNPQRQQIPTRVLIDYMNYSSNRSSENDLTVSVWEDTDLTGFWTFFQTWKEIAPPALTMQDTDGCWSQKLKI